MAELNKKVDFTRLTCLERYFMEADEGGSGPGRFEDGRGQVEAGDTRVMRAGRRGQQRGCFYRGGRARDPPQRQRLGPALLRGGETFRADGCGSTGVSFASCPESGVRSRSHSSRTHLGIRTTLPLTKIKLAPSSINIDRHRERLSDGQSSLVLDG